MAKHIKLIVLLGLMVLSVASHAQTGFGLKAGMNLTNLKVDDPEASYDSRTGYHLGIFIRSRFSKIAIQPEVLLWTQSTDVSSTLLGEYKDRFTYLAVPVVFKFYLIDGLNIHGGPQFGFLLDGERVGDSRLLGSSSRDLKDYYKESDISVSLGGGYDLSFGLSIDFRYNIGVQDINDVADGEEARSRVFMISLGYNFLR